MWNQLKDEAHQQRQPFNTGTDEMDSSMGLRVINKLIKKESMESNFDGGSKLFAFGLESL